MKVNKFVTKIIIRAFFILLFVALIPFLQDQSKFQHVYFTFHHGWEMIFPIILVIGFVSLLILCAVKKFNDQDLNWVLVLNTIILTAYGIAIYIRILHFMH